MNATYTVTEKTGCTYIHNSSFEGTGTFQNNRYRLDKAAVVAEAESYIKDDWFRSHYELAPKRVIAEHAQAYRTRLKNRPHKRYIDLDMPIVGDEGNW